MGGNLRRQLRLQRCEIFRLVHHVHALEHQAGLWRHGPLEMGCGWIEGGWGATDRGHKREARLRQARRAQGAVRLQQEKRDAWSRVTAGTLCVNACWSKEAMRQEKRGRSPQSQPSWPQNRHLPSCI